VFLISSAALDAIGGFYGTYLYQPTNAADPAPGVERACDDHLTPASVAPAASAAEAGQPNDNLAEQRRNRMPPGGPLGRGLS